MDGLHAVVGVVRIAAVCSATHSGRQEHVQQQTRSLWAATPRGAPTTCSRLHSRCRLVAFGTLLGASMGAGKLASCIVDSRSSDSSSFGSNLGVGWGRKLGLSLGKDFGGQCRWQLGQEDFSRQR